MKSVIRVHSTKRSSAKVRKDIRRAVKSAQKARSRMERYAHVQPLRRRVVLAFRLLVGKPIW